jgi:hypothetical protein
MPALSKPRIYELPDSTYWWVSYTWRGKRIRMSTEIQKKEMTFQQVQSYIDKYIDELLMSVKYLDPRSGT